MKILVDTSVWSLMLHRKKESGHPASLFLQQKIEERAPLVLAGIVYQEILQGIRSELHLQKVKKYLLDFDFLEETATVHEKAANLYQQCRRKGIQAHTIDSLIATLAIQNNCSLLTTDKDFERMAQHSSLTLAKYD